MPDKKPKEHSSTIKKFNVTVTRTDEYTVEIDTSYYDEAWFTAFRDVFFPFHTHDDVVKHLAQYQARFGSSDRFIEGFGVVRRNGEIPFSSADYDKKGNLKPEGKREKPAPGLNIVICSEDEDIETEVVECRPEPARSTR